jgi:hypothetical protein
LRRRLPPPAVAFEEEAIAAAGAEEDEEEEEEEEEEEGAVPAAAARAAAEEEDELTAEFDAEDTGIGAKGAAAPSPGGTRAADTAVPADWRTWAAMAPLLCRSSSFFLLPALVAMARSPIRLTTTVASSCATPPSAAGGVTSRPPRGSAQRGRQRRDRGLEGAARHRG